MPTTAANPKRAIKEAKRSGTAEFCTQGQGHNGQCPVSLQEKRCCQEGGRMSKCSRPEMPSVLEPSGTTHHGAEVPHRAVGPADDNVL